jgi:hypothetical protein
MADHFVGLVRGQEGFLYSDFVTGTATNATETIELRVRDGAFFTKKDVHNALDAFRRFFENAQQVSAAGFDVSDGKTQ